MYTASSVTCGNLCMPSVSWETTTIYRFYFHAVSPKDGEPVKQSDTRQAQNLMFLFHFTHFPLNHWEFKFSPNVALAAYNPLYFIKCEFILVKVRSRITEVATTHIGRFITEDESKTVGLAQKNLFRWDGTDTWSDSSVPDTSLFSDWCSAFPCLTR